MPRPVGQSGKVSWRTAAHLPFARLAAWPTVCMLQLRLLCLGSQHWLPCLFCAVRSLRQQLAAKCPSSAAASGKITPGSAIAYDAYLFSACTAAGTCDRVPPPPPDVVTHHLLVMAESCGSTSIGNGLVTWDSVGGLWRAGGE
jgi:hypothetical protein